MSTIHESDYVQFCFFYALPLINIEQLILRPVFLWCNAGFLFKNPVEIGNIVKSGLLGNLLDGQACSLQQHLSLVDADVVDIIHNALRRYLAEQPSDIGWRHFNHIRDRRQGKVGIAAVLLDDADDLFYQVFMSGNFSVFQLVGDLVEYLEKLVIDIFDEFLFVQRNNQRAETERV